MGEDANRELRSMMCSLLHLPPMPAIVCSIDREDNTLLSTDKTESSHTLIASLIEWMAVMDNVKLNNERMIAQITLQKMFHAQLESLNLSGPIEDIYNFYCHHTRLWVNSYTPIGQNLLFKPIDTITVGDKIHSTMLSYAKAQYHLFKDGKEELSIDDSISYADVLRKCAQWSLEWNRQAEEEMRQKRE